MELFRRKQDDTQRRGGTVKAVGITGRRVTLSPWELFQVFSSRRSSDNRGFTLIELVMTITIMTILTLGVIPLIKVSVKRQKEQQLRDSLRQIRLAIDEFHRDTIGMVCTGTAMPPGQPPTGGIPIDPRSKVVISDCTIFGVDNPDRYPPDLQTLVTGVNVIPRGMGMGGRGDPGVNATEVGSPELSTKKKVYLRAIPVDPMTNKEDWCLFSAYDEANASCGSTGGENVFDVRSKSNDTALNGRDKYSDW